MTSSVFNFYTDYTRPPPYPTCFSLCWMTSSVFNFYTDYTRPPPCTLPVSPGAGWPRVCLTSTQTTHVPPPVSPCAGLPLHRLPSPPLYPTCFSLCWMTSSVFNFYTDYTRPPPYPTCFSLCWMTSSVFNFYTDYTRPPQYPTCFSLCWMTSSVFNFYTDYTRPPPVPYLFLPVLDDLECV